MGQSSEDEYEERSENVSNISSRSSLDSAADAESQHQTDEHHDTQFYVAKFDFAYVDTPLLVAVWVLFTAAAKIGLNICSVTCRIND